MTDASLPRKASRIYSDEGFVALSKKSLSYVLRRCETRYTLAIEGLRKFVPGKVKQISLNGVTVRINTNPVDTLFPYYSPPYPTEDIPLYENVEADAIRKYAKDGADVVIIGGGLGVTAVIASRVTGGDVTVFEQSESTCQITEQTISENGCEENVNLRCAAVGEVAGSNFTHEHPSGTRVLPPEQLPEADVFEMDCEGAETAILKEMKVRPSLLLVETHNNHEEVVDILRDMGYEIIEVVDDEKGQASGCTHVRAEFTGTRD